MMILRIKFKVKVTFITSTTFIRVIFSENAYFWRSGDPILFGYSVYCDVKSFYPLFKI